MQMQTQMAPAKTSTIRWAPTLALTDRGVNGNAMEGFRDVFGDVIHTRRLRLRRIKPVDLRLLATWSNDRQAFGDYLTPERLSIERLQAKLDSGLLWSRHDKTLMIETREPALPIGTIHYWLRQDRRRCAVISVKIAAVEQRGRGFGTEAQKYLIIQLFDQVGVEQVEMVTDIDNVAQQRCLTKLGFSVARSLTYDDHQVQRTGHLYCLPREDFERAAVYRYHYE